jgi:2-phosphosulfolactate phosphatase
MRVHVALSPADFPAACLDRQTALVVDVIRASTTVVAACAAGCRRVLPVRDREAALRCAAALTAGEALLAGERDGETIPGFALGNSPHEYVAERVAGRTVVLTTTNGTAAMLESRRAAVAAVAALTNLEAATRWALEQGRDVIVLCAGEVGRVSLEDVVCAGFVVEGLASAGGTLHPSDGANAARRAADYYRGRLSGLAEDSAWARRLIARGLGADVDACLRLAGLDQVPVLRDGVISPHRTPRAAPPDQPHSREERGKESRA